MCNVIKHSFSYRNCFDNNSRFAIWWNIHSSTLVSENSKLIYDKPFTFSDTPASSNTIEFGVPVSDFWWLKQGNIGVQNVLRKNEPLSHLKNFPAFSIGYSHYPPALMTSLVFELECTSLIDWHSCFFLQINYEKFTCSVFTFLVYFKSRNASTVINIILQMLNVNLFIIKSIKIICKCNILIIEDKCDHSSFISY